MEGREQPSHKGSGDDEGDHSSTKDGDWHGALLNVHGPAGNTSGAGRSEDAAIEPSPTCSLPDWAPRPPETRRRRKP